MRAGGIEQYTECSRRSGGPIKLAGADWVVICGGAGKPAVMERDLRREQLVPYVRSCLPRLRWPVLASAPSHIQILA